MIQKKRKNILWGLPMVLTVLLLFAAPASAALFGEEKTEKPAPTFRRENDTIIAKLIPRAKNTSIQIAFNVNGGRLVDVEGMDFFEAATPEVDVKNFKSSLFVIQIDQLGPNGEATLSLTSDFFISSTQLYVYNPTTSPAWAASGVENVTAGEQLQKMTLRLQDGGPFDADGEENGEITLIAGPRDSFWGYALGTLFIRFFGIFLVLTVLMIGMLISGRVFLKLEKPSFPAGGAKGEPPAPEPVSAPEPSDLEGAVPQEIAAAIAVGLHLHFTEKRRTHAGPVGKRGASPAWAASGRTRIMNDRLSVYNR
ncbi:MAG: OadG family protein [Desulfobacterales bacterium]